jgi:sensor histidine kinase YesM
MSVLFDFIRNGYFEILIGILIFQTLYILTQYILTKRLEYFYYFCNILFGTYCGIIENTGDGKISMYNISVIGFALIFYWQFFRHVFGIKREEKINTAIIDISVGVYLLLLILDQITVNFFPVFQKYMLGISAILTYIPTVLSFVLYYRMFQSRDRTLALAVIIGSLLGEAITVPLQYLMATFQVNTDSVAAFPFFTASYVVESVFFTFALSYRSKLIQDANISLERKLNDAKLAALRAQMNPHFFNNSLNAINKLILNNENEAASYYLTKFSRLTRVVLNNSRKETISLSTELETVTLYLEMESLRFTDKFEYHVDIDPAINLEKIMIQPMILQPFVENAINHGLLRKQGERLLTISLSKQDRNVCITIKDNGIGFEQASKYNALDPSKEESYGISAIKERIDIFKTDTFLTLEDIHSDEHGTTVILTLKGVC